MPTRMRLHVITTQDEETDDWIKNVIGKDGLTSREREAQINAEVERQLAARDDLLAKTEPQLPIASLPEKKRPKPSAVHSDIQHVYGAEKHLPGKHDQDTHGAWARRTPEGGKREPMVKRGTVVRKGTEGKEFTIESMDYSSYSGASAWRKKQANAQELKIVREPDGKYYVVKPVVKVDTMLKPGVSSGAEVRAKLAEIDAAAVVRNAQLEKDYLELQEQVKGWRDDQAFFADNPAFQKQSGLDEETLVPKIDDVVSRQMDILGEQTRLMESVREQSRALLKPDVSIHAEINIIGKVPKKRQEVWEAGIDGFRSLVPEGIADAAVMGVTTPRKGTRRSYCDKTLAAVTASAGSSTVVHELGHALEWASPAVHQKALEFYERRTRGERAEWLGNSYGRDEVTRRDKFEVAYVGKDYGGGRQHTEVISMGLQQMFSNPGRFAKNDPDYFDFVWNDVLHGS